MPARTSSRKLDYAFEPNPFPIVASEPGMNPNTIGLQVIVSNPSRSIISMSKIMINIPMGHDVSRDLSTNTSLPSPLYDTNGPWSISTEGGTVTIVPKDDGVGKVTAPIRLSLPGIVVNETPGAVPLTITEVTPSGSQNRDADTYKLEKQSAGLPVTNFRAEPASVADHTTPVRLKWDCTDKVNGEYPVFGLRSDPETASFKRCGEDGDCYTRQDGVDGVVVSELAETTTFTLDVVTPSSVGHRTVLGRLTMTVQYTGPRFSQDRRIAPLFGGRVLRLHWRAYDAAFCTVEVDGVVTDHHAPTDTETAGYLCVPPVQDGVRTVTVTAHASPDDAPSFLTFPPQQVTPISRICALAGDDSAIAMFTSHAGTFALVTAPTGLSPPAHSDVLVIDLATRQAEAATIPVPGMLTGIAVTPNGSHALVVSNVYAGHIAGVVSVLDVPGRRVVTTDIPMPPSLASVAITPDEKTALVTTSMKPAIAEVHIPGFKRGKVLILAGSGTTSIAITPTGDLALVTHPAEGKVSVFDIQKRELESKQIDAGKGARDVAITPDGTLALVVNSDDSTVSVIDIAHRSAEANVIHTGPNPRSIAISPDGSLALTANRGGSLTVIDIARRTGASIPWERQPWSVSIAPDGVTALVASSKDAGGYLDAI